MLLNISLKYTLAAAFAAAYILLGFLWFINPAFMLGLVLILPLQVVYFLNIRQTKQTILRNYPVVGHLRYMLENIRPELRQYFFESDTDGRPFNRRQRSIVYQRAKNVRQTVPFGMQEDSQKIGHEWLAHAMFPVKIKDEELRVNIGSSRCKQPYSASIFNISAMSYGSLSKTAISSLNSGARMGRFAHNTGEGGISPYHLQGGDLIWQIGTGYFGCRDRKGNFDEDIFRAQARRSSVKMIELKLSQGAKPGHGGILPSEKNTLEIASIRRVEPYTTVQSPPAHTAFSDYFTMLLFVDKLRLLAEGKPVGIKLCIGSKQEFEQLCMEMQHHQLFPDFITIDGAEGGTGAAPLEFTDNLGMPLYDALAFAHNTLKQSRLRHEIKLLAAGKIISAADILKTLALGADACYSARGMMFALGCIQALKCDSGRCPVGIATQDKRLYNGLDMADKRVRVANFHQNTIKAVIELMEACGFRSLSEVTADKIFRRIEQGKAVSLQELYFHNTKISKQNGNYSNFTLN